MINDVIFNNYNGYSKGKFVDDSIDNVEVAVPKEGGRILQSKQNDEITLSGVNFKKYKYFKKSIFFRTNSTFGIVLNVCFKINKKKEYKFFIHENGLDEIQELTQKLLLQKKHLGIKDLVISYQGKNKYQLLVKISQDKVF